MNLKRRSLLLVLVCALLAGLGLYRVGAARADLKPGADSTSARDLAGWWLAIDPWFPTMWKKGVIPAMEELLVVDASGHVDDRAMQFFTPDASFCADTGNLYCSDAPVVVRARLAMSGDRLRITHRVDEKVPVFSRDPGLNLSFHKALVTGTPSWTVSRSAGGRVLTLRSDNSSLTRVLVKVDPDRLRRLRAGLVVAELAAQKYWRCYLANATAGDPSFAPLHTAASAAPDFLDDFLKAASYAAALGDAASRAVPDDPDPKQRKLASAPLERGMLERFPDIRLPTSAAERDKLRARLTAFHARMAGKSAQPEFPLTDAEFAALARVMRQGAEARRLFCAQ